MPAPSTVKPARRRLLMLAGVLLAALTGATTLWIVREAHGRVIVFKSPDCECCARWVTYLRGQGLDVTVRPIRDLSVVKRRLGVPASLASCHTAEFGSWVLEGHVPVEAISRLASGAEGLRGVAVPGMPAGSPGMESLAPQPYVVHGFTPAGASAPWLAIDAFGVPAPQGR